MKIPIILKLKKVKHREIAKAQDFVVEELYNFFNNAVLHGGTAIWRCYNGNRFSEDIDVYIERDLKKLEKFFDSLKKKNFQIKKKKIGQRSLFSVLSYNGAIIRFEALFKKVKGILTDYETAEGNFITVFTLPVEKLIEEKVEAYLKRRKIRDLYDIFFLVRLANIKSIKKLLRKLVENFKKPADENQLRVLIISGMVPSYKQMIEYIKRVAKRTAI